MIYPNKFFRPLGSAAWLKPAARAAANLSISRKLNLGFGVLVGLTFLVVARNSWGSLAATANINRTEHFSVPTALASNRAQEDLLKMSAHIRAYLVTGESEYRDLYHQARQAFDRELETMLGLLENKAARTQIDVSESTAQLAELRALYDQWRSLPEELFALSDRDLENRPALKQFQETGDLALLNIQADMQALIDLQAARSPSAANTQMLKNLAALQNSFALSGASLRAYIITRNADFRFEYAGHLMKNKQQWEEIAAGDLTPAQREAFASIEQYRQQFFDLAPDLFEIVEGDRYREDLFIFSTKIEPLASEMLTLLNEIVSNQQQRLADDLTAGREGLMTAQWQTLMGSFLALAIASAMALLLRQKIADPIVRLTRATTQVMEGNFDTKAPVESRDEIGTLAETFNCMTGYLKQFRQDLEAYNTTLKAQKLELEAKNVQVEQTLAALKTAQAQLVQTEKMSSLGQMVAGIAHEINNPVNFIHGNLHHTQVYTADLIDLIGLYHRTYPQATAAIEEKQQEIDLDFLKTDISRMFDSMQTGTQRIRDIVLSLRNFSRLDESDMKQACVEEGLDSTLLILQNRTGLQAFRPAIEIVKHYGDLPDIECYPGQLNQVFFNLLVNAIDAIDRAAAQRNLNAWRPQIVLKTEVRECEAFISVTDNGEGIAAERQRQIFDPFFTTKPVGQGTGMGLSISHKIVVEQHQGELGCHSTPEEGTTFYIVLPYRQIPEAAAVLHANA